MRVLFSLLVCATPWPYSFKPSTPYLLKCNVNGLNLAECFTTLYWCEVNGMPGVGLKLVSLSKASPGISAFTLTEALSLWVLIVPSRVSFSVMREKKIWSLSLPIYCYCCEAGGKARFVHIFLLCAKKLCLLPSFDLCISIQQFIMKICIL